MIIGHLPSIPIVLPSRRSFIGGMVGLTVAFTVMPRGPLRAQGAPAAPPVVPNAFIHIAEDDTVTILSKHIEMGQGPYTGLATLIAEELDADWSQMRAIAAPGDDSLYANLLFGSQGTGGSTAIANSFLQMRKVGAAVRGMLVAAAAQEWAVPAEEITVKAGVVAHSPSGKTSGFGALAAAAAQMDIPQDPPVKDPKDWVLIGTDRPKLDTVGKTDGTAMYTMDVYKDGMLTVMVSHPPKFGATLKSFDAADALKIRGVKMVKAIPSGVAVYATGTYPAMKGRAALKVVWDDAGSETRSSSDMFDELLQAVDQGGITVEEQGDVSVIDQAAFQHEAVIRFPYLAHAPMEPLDAVISWKDGAAEMWFGSQFPSFDKPTAASVLGIGPDKVTINVLLAGGSFGRRAQGTAHLAAEAAEIANAGGEGTYKLVWSREDDLRGGYYRPMTVHRLRAGMDADGKIVGWTNAIANQSIMSGTPMEAFMQEGRDPTSYEGAVDLPYDLGARHVSWAQVKNPVSVLWWRSVGSTHTAFAVETFLDELLQKAGKDPVQGRLDLLKPGAVRERAVIEAVAKLADWKGPTQDGKAYGVAYAKSFGTYVAQIVEVEDGGGLPRVTHVWCAVDCGVAVNPNVIRAQIEGGVGFALSAALYSEITLEKGEVVQGNFDTYPMLRIHEMPKVDVVIIPSTEAPTGIGEPGVPPTAPAVANAWRVLTGAPTRQLPFASGAAV